VAVEPEQVLEENRVAAEFCTKDRKVEDSLEDDAEQGYGNDGRTEDDNNASCV